MNLSFMFKVNIFIVPLFILFWSMLNYPVNTPLVESYKSILAGLVALSVIGFGLVLESFYELLKKILSNLEKLNSN